MQMRFYSTLKPSKAKYYFQIEMYFNIQDYFRSSIHRERGAVCLTVVYLHYTWNHVITRIVI